VVEGLLFAILVFMVLGSIIAVETRDLLSSVIAVGAVGFGLAVVFLILAAPDLAIVQVVVEVLTLIMLLRVVVSRKDETLAHSLRRGAAFAAVAGVAFCTIFLVYGWVCFQDLPAFGEPLMRVSHRYIEQGLAEVNAPNLVTAVLLDYRAYDTLGEATVIFTAIVGALAILRRKGRTTDERGDDADR